MVEFLVLLCRRRPQVVEPVGPVIVAQRLFAVDSLRFGVGHIFPEAFFVHVAVGFPFQQRFVEFEFHCKVVRLDIGEEPGKRPFALVVPEMVGLHVGVVDAEIGPLVIS